MRIVILAVLMALVAGCATKPDITVAYDENRDFSRYQTYAWLGDGAPKLTDASRVVPDEALSRLQNAVRAELSAKGLTEVADPAEADIGVRVLAGVAESVIVESDDRSVYVPTSISATRVDRGPLRDAVVLGGSDYARVDLNPLMRTIDEGRLVIIISDIPSGQKVWSASASKDMTDAAIDGSNADSLVRFLLKDYPPQ